MSLAQFAHRQPTNTDKLPTNTRVSITNRNSLGPSLGSEDQVERDQDLRKVYMFLTLQNQRRGVYVTWRWRDLFTRCSLFSTESTMESKRLVLFFLSTCLLLPCRARYIEGFRICFRQTGSQFQGISSTCSGYSPTNEAWSSPFRDDTGGQSKGGHKYEWRIEAGHKIPQYKEYRLCFWETEGSSQCKKSRNSCTGWSSSPAWTSPFRDLTNEESGGCRYSWLIQSQYHKYSSRFQVCRVCFKEVEGTSQCQGTRKSCSGWAAPGADPSWTLPFHDNTDNRGGGCTYQWHLDCTSMYYAIFCPRDSPCKRIYWP